MTDKAADGFRRRGTDILVDIRLTPRADRDGIDGPRILADGTTVLAARVRSVAEDGKANAALTALVAKALSVPRSRVTLESGATQRRKTLRIAEADASLEATLRQLLGG